MVTAINTTEVPKEPAKRRAWVIFQLKIRNTNMRRLARKWGVTPSAVQNALYVPSSHIESALAKVLGLTPQQLFPERFDSAGERLHVTMPAKRSRAGIPRNVQVQRAS